MPPRKQAAVAVAPAAAEASSLEQLHRVHLKRTAELFSDDVGGRAELDEARRVSQRAAGGAPAWRLRAGAAARSASPWQPGSRKPRHCLGLHLMSAFARRLTRLRAAACARSLRSKLACKARAFLNATRVCSLQNARTRCAAHVRLRRPLARRR